MAYSDKIESKLDQYFYDFDEVTSKKMFGGLCYLWEGHMLCGIVGDELMLRVGPEQYPDLLDHADTREMDFTGKAMKGMLYLSEEGFATEEQLDFWIKRCMDFVTQLPPKKPKKG